MNESAAALHRHGHPTGCATCQALARHTFPCNPPHPTEARPSLHCFARQYLLRWFVFPICHTHVLALLFHYFKSVTCVYSVILSPKAVYRVSCPFFRPKMFSPCDRVWYHSRTFGAHVLATVVGPSPKWPQYCRIWCIRPGGATQVDLESAQLSRLEAVVVASPKSLACISGGYHSLL